MLPSTTSRSCWRRPEAGSLDASIALHVLRFDLRSGLALSDSRFAPQERVTLASLRGARRAEWAASRVAAKECVRRLLDHGTEAHRIEVHRDRSGVPWARVGPHRLPLSLSHTSGWAVAAAHTRLHVGVDVEPARPLPHRFSRYFVSPAEVDVLEGWGHRPTASLAAWTVKEAVLKSMGLGLSMSPRALRIRSIDGEGHVAVAAGGVEVGATCWREGDAVVALAWAGASEAPGATISRSHM
jgi:phosphopantetheinyl transferase